MQKLLMLVECGIYINGSGRYHLRYVGGGVII